MSRCELSDEARRLVILIGGTVEQHLVEQSVNGSESPVIERDQVARALRAFVANPRGLLARLEEIIPRASDSRHVA